MKLRLLNQHDYISLVHPNWRFTIARSGEKGSGVLARDDSGFNALADYIRRERESGKTNGNIMAALANPETLSQVWPGWDVAVAVVDFKVGERARFAPIAGRLVQKYPGEHEVTNVSRKYVFLRLPDGTSCGFEKAVLEKVN